MHPITIDPAVIYTVITTVLAFVSFIVGWIQKSPRSAALAAKTKALNSDLQWLALHLTTDVTKRAVEDVNNPAQAVQDAACAVGITVSDTTAQAFVQDVLTLYRRTI
jgi:hypothetical protein